ncbi:MAG: 30S ribosomal protein S16 [Verrucomicrobiales bacterium]
MAVAIRLRREGTKNTPFYRIVVADSRKRRDGRFIEQIGHYDPLKDGTNYQIDLTRATDWLSKGARASETVASLIKKAQASAG